ncbi:MAG: hypothetical protein NZL87_02685, partial [Thermomicrobium sp.]|nr:hypothetical protein [Thermomicrobium sp.]
MAFPVQVRRHGERLDHMEQELVALARAVRELVQVVAHQEALRTRLVAIGERHEATLAKWRVIAQRHAERVGRLVAMTERHRRTSVELRQSARRHDDRLECLTQLRQRQGRELREMRSEIGSSTVMISAMVEADAADAVVAARA